jgi:hypothetical protein
LASDQLGANNAQGQFSCQGNFNGWCAMGGIRLRPNYGAEGRGFELPSRGRLKAKAIKENLSSPYALCLTSYALRLMPYALCLMPHALRLIFKLRLSANFSSIFQLKVRKSAF